MRATERNPVTQSRGPSSPFGSARTSAIVSESPFVIAQRQKLQGMFGEAAALPIQRHEVVQRVKLGKSLKKDVERWAGDDARDVVVWFEAATQLSAGDVLAATARPFDAWWNQWASETEAEVTSDELRNNAKAGAKAKAPAEEDRLSEVRKKLVAAKQKPSDFSEEELRTILAAKDGPGGWKEAIKGVDTERRARIGNQRLISERTAKYSAVKIVGNAAFGAGLIRAIWDLSYGIATAGSAPPNTTLAASYSDGDIQAAADLWHDHDDLVPPAVAPNESVTRMHVPGAPERVIEDKSTRLRNPDPNRGRQADFISSWGGGPINVHVNSTTKH